MLGGVLIDPEALNKVVDVIDVEDFYREDHRAIFQVVLDLYERNEPIDLVTVSSSARDRGLIEKIGGVANLSRLVDGMPTSANIAQYAKMVKEKALLRNLMHIATEIVERGYEVDTNVDNFIDEAEKMIFEISEKKYKPSFYAIKDLVMENVKVIERLCEKKQAITGVPTGFTELDKMTSGLQNSDLIIVAGRPSMGKTALCLNIAQHVALSDGGTPVGIFSLEMSKEQLVMRLLSSEAEVEFSKLRSGMVKDTEWHQLGSGGGKALYRPHVHRRYPCPEHLRAAGEGEEIEERARPRPPYHRLPPAYARQDERSGPEGTGDIGDIEVPQGPGQGAEKALNFFGILVIRMNKISHMTDLHGSSINKKKRHNNNTDSDSVFSDDADTYSCDFNDNASCSDEGYHGFSDATTMLDKMSNVTNNRKFESCVAKNNNAKNRDKFKEKNTWVQQYDQMRYDNPDGYVCK